MDQLTFPARVELARLPTPLQPLDRITEKYSTPSDGPRIWVKRDDLTEAAMSGNKLRKLEFIAGAALEQGYDTLITCGGLQSNHCRTTALVGARLGLNVHLILRGEHSGDMDGNLLVDRLAGAKVSFYPPRQYFREQQDIFAHWEKVYADHGHRALLIPTGASDGLGIWGYLAGSRELIDDCRREGFEPGHVVCATGSGGTQAGLTLGFHLAGMQTQVTGYAVCDDEAFFVRKVREDVVQWASRNNQQFDENSLNIAVSADYIGPGYGVAEVPVYQTIAEAAALEGLLLDPVYTGKAFHGLLQDLGHGKYRDCDNLVFVHTGGHYGLFPHREHFAFLG
ncbi:D-cysteine desulfhydrase family protein [Microbulbifer sediminum]|uniref:D-cysteine desulfhydrase family protein n=1 Tax=Microbulbifer sediminum TaxID=2904250 RepID=UPI001F26D7DC|nr:D-cysteine desulfhydrase family protein [Microbulbifer sediminum]